MTFRWPLDVRYPCQGLDGDEVRTESDLNNAGDTLPIPEDLPRACSTDINVLIHE